MEILLLALIIPIYFFLTLIAIMGLLSYRDTGRTKEILSRVESIEEALSNAVEPYPVEMWQSADGKYQASSFEELLAKMAGDPDSGLTEDQINVLKSIFERIEQIDDSEDDETEDYK